MQHFHERLTEVREEQGLSKSDISEILDIHPQTWHKYESGISKMNLETLSHFCSTMGVSADWLLGLIDHKEITYTTPFYIETVNLICDYERDERMTDDCASDLLEDLKNIIDNE